MVFNPDIHRRKSLRLENYDYSKKGLYFITISLKYKLCFLGEIKNDIIKLFESWKMVKKIWLELEEKFKNIKLHNFVVMPNHFHWIIEINDDNIIVDNNDSMNIDKNRMEIDYNENRVKIDNNENRVNTRFTPTGGKFKYNKNSLSSIIQAFKSKTTNEYIKLVYAKKAEPFDKKLWQKDFYEHIIRNDKEYFKIDEYIRNNVKNWKEDKFYYTEL